MILVMLQRVSFMHVAIKITFVFARLKVGENWVNFNPGLFRQIFVTHWSNPRFKTAVETLLWPSYLKMVSALYGDNLVFAVNV